MKVSYNWLKDFVDIQVSPIQLSNDLVQIGFEVEELIDLSKEIQGVVVGKITDIQPHPNADKLRICQVDVGDKSVQIITHADNVFVGAYVPAALDGAYLPGGKRIFDGELRGLPSYGMMCAGEELGLTEADFPNGGVDGIMLLDEYPLGTDINKIIGNDDFVLDISITANRPDCQSILGIAREVAALYHLPLTPPALDYESVDFDLNLTVENTAMDLCPRYMAGVVKDIVLKPSPVKIASRLRAVGLRPINNIVDITNYILIEIGQPMHAFDKSLLEGDGIVVRRAVDGEVITTLDGKESALDNSMLVIADTVKPSALAGIMGGANSGINDNVTTIVFESAKFARDSIRRTSRTLNVHSDSSARYEKGIDYISQEIALKRAFNLIYTTNSGVIASTIIDKIDRVPTPTIIDIDASRIRDILGIDVADDFVIDTLQSLSIDATIKDGRLIANIPAWREDLLTANDISEEIIRFYGYDHIQPTLLPKAEQTCGYATLEQRDYSKLTSILTGLGLNEIVAYSFVTSRLGDLLKLDEKDSRRIVAKLLNPLSDEWSTMRTTLAHSMLLTLATNSKKGNKDARLFELAKVYLPKSMPISEQPDEIGHLSIGVYGENCDFYSLKGIIETLKVAFGVNITYQRSTENFLHPGRSASVYCNSEYIGYIGEVHPDVLENYEISTRAYIGEIDTDKLLAMANHTFKYAPIPKYPAVERDFAMTIREDMPVGKVIDIMSSQSDLIEDIQLFDIYRGDQVEKGYKSVAIKLILRSLDHTLKDKEIQAVSDSIISALSKEGINLR
ncbi:MAG: phenylalanine--tRNA ligase subunit beta [Clostridia bacterium]|nr:phenylalanine--tRNA ligase subunit beta [Clostridia bacterium]